MKLAFPSKKFQLWLIFLGTIFPLFLFFVLIGNLIADEHIVVLESIFLAPAERVIYWLTSVVLNGVVGESFFFSFTFAILKPVCICILYGLTFWLSGSIIWMINAEIKKKKNAQ